VFSRDGKKELPTWGSCSSKPEVTPKIMYAFSLRSAKKPMIVVVVIAVVVVYANYITEIFLTLFNLLSLRLNLNCVTASMISKQQGGETAIKSDKGGEAGSGEGRGGEANNSWLRVVSSYLFLFFLLHGR